MLTVEQIEVTQADRALAKAIYLAYKRSGLPCEGAQLVAAHRIAGEQAIVAWLRSEAETSDCVYWSGAAIDIADSIERGEHLKDTP